MSIEIKISKKPVEYTKAIIFLEKRLHELKNGKATELVWMLEHPNIYTGGTSYKNHEILDKNIKIINTNRGGKITWHGPGQTICYFVIDLTKRNKDIRKFILNLEKIIIKTLDEYNIKSFSDRKNIGIWVKHKNKIKKIAAIGIKVKNWIAYHGFSVNIKNDLKSYKKIIPCGIIKKEVINLIKIKNQEYNLINKRIIKNFIKYLKV